MSRNLALFTGAAVAFYLIGMVNGSIGMYALAAAAVAVVLACYSLTRFLIRGVEAELEVADHRTWAEGTVSGTLTVRHLGLVRRSGLEAALTVEVGPEDEDAGGLGPQRRYVLPLPALPPQTTMEFAVTLDWLGRGVHRVPSVELVSRDPLAMYRRPLFLPCEAEFLGMPQVYHAEGLTAWDLMTPEARRAARRRQISSGEFRGIRPHAEGDDLRHVHWKVTAHTGELVVKEFQHREEAEVAVWVDLELRPSGSWYVDDEEDLEPDGEPQPRTLLERVLDYLGLGLQDDYRGARPTHDEFPSTLGGAYRWLLRALGLAPWDDDILADERATREEAALDMEMRISLAASLVSAFVRHDLSVSLAGQGLSASLLSPSRGDAYLDHALVELAKAGPSREGFAAFCMERIRRSHRLENVFLVAARVDDELVEVARELSLRGVHVGVYASGVLSWAADDLRALNVALVDLALDPGEAALGAMAQSVETLSEEGASVGGHA